MVCPIDFDKNLPKSSCQYACRPRMVHGYPAKNVQIMFDRRQKRDVSQIIVEKIVYYSNREAI